MRSLQCGTSNITVREPRTAFVEEDQAREFRKARKEPVGPAVLPHEIKMAHESGNEHQIAGSIAHDLVGDVHTVRCLGVASPGPFLHKPSLARDSQGGECRSDEEKGHRPGGDGTPWTSPGAEAAPCNSGAVGNPEPRTALSRRRSRTTRPTLNRRPVGAPDRHRVPGARASMRARHGARVCGVVESVRSD